MFGEEKRGERGEKKKEVKEEFRVVSRNREDYLSFEELPVVGVLLDVSASMKACYGLQYDRLKKVGMTQSTRLSTSMDAICDFAKKKQDHLNGTDLFIYCFGLYPDCAVETCDLIELLKQCASTEVSLKKATDKDYTRLSKLLSENGAPYCEKYIKEYLTTNQAMFVADFFKKHPRQLEQFVPILPKACRDPFTQHVVDSPVFNILTLGTLTDTKDSTAISVWTKAMDMVCESHREEYNREICRFQECKLHDACEVSKVLEEFSTKYSYRSEILELCLAPFPFGTTPMCKAIEQVKPILIKSDSDPKPPRCVVIISDGLSTDGDPTDAIQELLDDEVIVIGCFLTEGDSHVATKRLFARSGPDWGTGAKCLFGMCSEMRTNHSVLMTLKRTAGWRLPREATVRLFVQGNHPGMIDEVMTLAENLSDMENVLIREYNLSVRIRKSVDGAEAPKQVKGSCYANAVASAIALANARVVGRLTEPFNYYFNDLRERIIAEYGYDGANTFKVLKKYCKLEHDLRVKEINEEQARQALNAGRVVVARCYLKNVQWTKFSKFFKDNPRGVLKDVGPTPDEKHKNDGGHAVLLVNHLPDCLIFMNSWGTCWADKGFFYIESASVMPKMKFYDVFWYESDLTAAEKAAFLAYN